MTKTATIYCSGPLFCPEEQGGMLAIARVVEGAGYRTFLPQRDGLEPRVMGLVNAPLGRAPLLGRARRLVNRAIFALDIYQLVECCDALVFNMNGRVPDEGGVVETAVAFATGTPVVTYKNDYRSVFGGDDNAMLIGLDPNPPVGDVASLPAAVTKALRSAGPRPGELAPRLREVVSLGREVARFLKVVGFFDAPSKELPRLVEEIATLCEASPAF